MSAILGSLGTVLAAAGAALIRSLAAPLAGYLLQTRDLAGSPGLLAVYRSTLALLLACLVVPLALTGLSVVTGSHRRPAGLAVGRNQLAALLTAAVALPATGLEAGLANRMVDVILPAGPTRIWASFARMPFTSPGSVAVTVAGVVTAVLLVVVAVLALARWATVWLLVAIAPVAMAFALLPGATRLTMTWWRLQSAALFLPVAQATALAAYVAMFSGARDPVVGAFAGVAVLVLVAKLPSWAAGMAAGAEMRDFTLRARGAYWTSRASRDLLPIRREARP